MTYFSADWKCHGKYHAQKVLQKGSKKFRQNAASMGFTIHFDGSLADSYLRHLPGVTPNACLKARLNAASDSYPTS